MKLVKELNISGAPLDKNQLESYLKKIASNHILTAKSSKNTFPTVIVKSNFQFITQVYHVLNEHIKLGINIHPAGEWLLDNYYIIEETANMLQKELTIKKYKNLTGIENDMYKGFARVYVLASEIVAHTDSRLEEENLKELLKAYQDKKSLSMEELNNIKMFLQIALIKNVKQICESIYYSQIQKYKVESIIERLIEKKEKKDQLFKQHKYVLEKFITNEMKYPFIEYMSYKLKKHGKQSYYYFKILEEQVEKAGSNVSDIIKKEHFEIAIQKVSMGNSIKSLKELLRMDFLKIFEAINDVEALLKKDPAGVYETMDYKTKIYYRNTIKEIAEQTKTSESYIARKVLELSEKGMQNKEEMSFTKQDNIYLLKKAHVGYYLIAEGILELYHAIELKKNKRTKEYNSRRYIVSIVSVSAIFTIMITFLLNISFSRTYLAIYTLPLLSFFLYILFYEICTKTLQYFSAKTTKPKLIPKLDLSNGIKEEQASFVVIPTIVKSREKIIEIMKKLEIYYLANKSENIYFALLGDSSSGSKEDENFDFDIMESGKEEIEKLNQKYKNEECPRFHFLYRKRKWNAKEKSYLGWERKRGLLNEFNEFLLDFTKNDFKYNSLENSKIPYIKYIITLDVDTELVLNTAFELIGAMSHILNKPVIDKEKNVVINGYGIMQPRVEIDLSASRKSLFTKIFAGLGGTDMYTNAMSDVYQDNFEQGIFTGKGIYDLQTFSEVLKNAIPENTVLSHDLLEGNYLRCGLVTDIMIMDGYPAKYNSYISRQHRWIRGDWQIAKWIQNEVKDRDGKKIINPLNELSKFKILDNLIRSLISPTIFLSIFLAMLIYIFTNIELLSIFVVAIVTISTPAIIDIINYIIFKKDISEEYIVAQKNFSSSITGISASILRVILELSFLPHKAYISLNAIVKTIYRLNISKQNMLEWQTSEEAEKQAKTDLFSYYKNMAVNSIFGALSLFFFLSTNKILVFILAGLWLMGPFFAYYISQEKKEVSKIGTLSKIEKEYVLEIASRTWTFFKEYMNEENHFLPPDNYQEDRKEKIAKRTSPTNIGLGILVVISSYDLGFESLGNTIQLLYKVLKTIKELPKWNGHLYNWYRTDTLELLLPRFVSTVDSGNFLGYLYVLKQFLLETEKKLSNEKMKENKKKIKSEKIDIQISEMIKITEEIMNNTNFSLLYDEKQKLFSIGYHMEEGKCIDSYYDLLASEARQTSLLAIARREVPIKHWNTLGRVLTCLNRYKGLISWSGTSFEYFMSNINIRRYKGSILDESCKFALMSQKEYAKKLNIPWGVSESAFYLKDLNLNYQYKAFGIPWLGLKRGLANEMVVAPYGSIMAIIDEPKEVIQNLKRLEQQEMFQKYGFYESIDYTPTRLKSGQKYAIVKTYMAHHQGLILASINNLINANILQKRFFENPEISAIDILLQERMPTKIIITKEKKEKVEKLKYLDHEEYSERIYTKINEHIKNGNVISNDNYTICIDDRGQGFSKYKNIYINRFKKTEDTNQGIFFYIKNIKTKRIWTNNYINCLSKPDKYKIIFAPDINKINRTDGSIETTTKITVSGNEPLEIRRLEIKNIGLNEEILEISSFLEPILSGLTEDYAHKAFNNLFLSYEYFNDCIIAKRKTRNPGEKDIYAGIMLYTENETIGDLEFELDKEKFIGRTNLNVPFMVKDSKPFSKMLGLFTESVVSFKRTIKLQPGEKAILDLLITVSNEKEEIKRRLEKYKETETISKEFEISKARLEAQNRYLDLDAEEIETYQKMLYYILFENKIKKLLFMNLTEKTYSQEDLWKYGISGDLPIVVGVIKDVNDIHVIAELIKAHEFFRTKNIVVDLVILNEEENLYEQYVREQVESIILNKNISYLRNISGGIFLFNTNEMTKEDRELFMFKAEILIHAKDGSIKVELAELEEEYLDSIKDSGNEKILEENERNENYLTIPVIQDMNYLKYNNEFGGFSEDGKEYILKINKENKLPTVWSHIIANENFGTVVTENLGGYTWSENSRLKKLSAWYNGAVGDIPSEIIYIKNKKTGKAWSIGNSPMPDNNDYYVTYGFGYAIYKHFSDGIIQELTIFVPRNDKAKVQILNLKNMDHFRKELKLIYYIKPAMAEDEMKSNSYIEIQKQGNMMIAKNLYKSEVKDYMMYVCTSEQIKSYTGSKSFFIGSGSLENPSALNKVELNNENSIGQDSCVAIEVNISLDSYENKEISIVLGEEKKLLDAKNMAYKYSNLSNCKEQLKTSQKYWDEQMSIIQVKTPIESINIMLNGWALYQTIVSRLWARSGYYQSGGAFGFRDQLQDTIGLKYMNPEFMKNQIIKAASHQFLEGDVEHWWHEDTQKGIRTRFSDDLLWLVYVVCEYIHITNEYEILNMEAPYLEGQLLEENENEKYDKYYFSDKVESIFLHCEKAIKIAINKEENELPKIGSGDWNDGFSTIGNKGKGTSIWLGFFIYDILTKWIPICKKIGKSEMAVKYENVRESLEKVLNIKGWDGRWYRRAFTDEGEVIGSIENEECKIDSISQSWAIISGAGDNDKKYICLESLETHLIDKENGIIKLLDPPFDKGKLSPGYIKAYMPGVRENGGQYTHRRYLGYLCRNNFRIWR